MALPPGDYLSGGRYPPIGPQGVDQGDFAYPSGGRFIHVFTPEAAVAPAAPVFRRRQRTTVRL